MNIAMSRQYNETKRRYFWLVELPNEVDREVYLRIKAACVIRGGWYSRKWKECPKGFAFPDDKRASALKFVELLKIDYSDKWIDQQPAPIVATPEKPIIIKPVARPELLPAVAHAVERRQETIQAFDF